MAIHVSADRRITLVANAGPWRELAARTGLRLGYWFPTAIKGSSNPYAVAYDVNTLLPLITQNTRIVAITACSNVLGSAVDIKSVVKQVRGLCVYIVCGGDVRLRKLDSRKSC